MTSPRQKIKSDNIPVITDNIPRFVSVDKQGWDGLSPEEQANKVLVTDDRIEITVKDSGRNKALNITFGLYKDKNLTKKINESTSDANGKLYFSGLDLGDIWLKQELIEGEKLFLEEPINFFVDDGTRFLGEVSSTDLINGTDLANKIGLTAGTVMSANINNNWLKFEHKGQEMYVAKKPYRNYISWNDINLVGAVLGKEIDINGKKYLVRLLKGYNDNINWNHNNTWQYSNDLNTEHTKASHGSEWNKLILSISGSSQTGANTVNHLGSIMINFAQYNWFYDLGGASQSDGSTGRPDNDRYGTYSWCQEYGYNGTNYRVFRGSNFINAGTTNCSSEFSNYKFYYSSFRPVLIFTGN